MNEPRVIDIDLVRSLPLRERLSVMSVRNDWLKRQRRQDRKEQIAILHKRYYHLAISLGFCGSCFKRFAITGLTYCCKCKANMMKAQRRRRRLISAKRKQ